MRPGVHGIALGGEWRQRNARQGSPFKARCQEAKIPTQAKEVFGLMTSFTKCLGTCFTLPCERSERRSVNRDALEDHGCQRTASVVRGGGEAAGEAVHGALSGVRHIASHRGLMGKALSAAGGGRYRRTQPASLAQSTADGGGLARPGGRAAPGAWPTLSLENSMVII